MKKIVLLLAVILVLPIVAAKEGSIPLLAVKETKEGYEGSIATLYLEIKSGEGRVFLDTFPLTKLDTQMSTRFAKEIACNYLDISCDDYDFIYRIKANSAIVGGPSAGAAATLLTISLLSDTEIDEKTSITGTINSGGLIGPVSGLKEKIDAGKEMSLQKIFIPKGKRFIEKQKEEIELTDSGIKITAESNETIDLVDYGKENGIEVIEVADLDELISNITGISEKTSGNISIDPSYKEVMKSLAGELCNRTEEFKAVLLNLTQKNMSEELLSSKKSAENLTRKGKESFEKGDYYTTASYCFGANIKYNYLVLYLKNFSREDLSKKIKLIDGSIKFLDESLDKESIKTITDLESYMIVKERIIESEDYLSRFSDDGNYSLYDVSYGIERLHSAYAWHDFFGKSGREFNFDEEVLESSCREKLAEADERYQYANLVLSALPETKKEIDYAYSDLENKDYELCLFKASKAKAEADYVLSLIGVGEGQLDVLIDTKADIIRKNIAKETERGIFPILGYSYLEYAESLKEDDKLSALVYLEYALELSNLRMYFEEKEAAISYEFDYSIVIFVFGAVIGYIVGISRKKKHKKR